MRLHAWYLVKHKARHTCCHCLNYDQSRYMPDLSETTRDVAEQVKPCTFVRGLPGYGLVEFDVSFRLFNISFFKSSFLVLTIHDQIFVGQNNAGKWGFNNQSDAISQILNSLFALEKNRYPPFCTSYSRVQWKWEVCTSIQKAIIVKSNSGVHTSINEWTSTWSQNNVKSRYQTPSNIEFELFHPFKYFSSILSVHFFS